MQPRQRMVLYIVVNLAYKTKRWGMYRTLQFREKNGKRQFLENSIFSDIPPSSQAKDIPPNSCTAPLAAETMPHIIMHPARYQLGRRIPSSILLGTGSC